MSILYDDETHLSLGDPDVVPHGTRENPDSFDPGSNPAADPAADPAANPAANVVADTVREAASSMLRTVSGWRKVFAADMHDHGTELSSADIDLICCVAAAYHTYLSESAPASSTVGIAVDSRPTGGVIADVLIRCFVSLGLSPEYFFICPTPQIMAASAAPDSSFSEFIMITASHNPVGYNGFKFGRNGTVLSATEHSRLLHSFNQLLMGNLSIVAAVKLRHSAPTEALKEILGRVTSLRHGSAEQYEDLIASALGPGGAAGFEDLRNLYRDVFEQRRLGVVIDHNGGARCTSIDQEFLESLGIRVQGMNTQARDIRHEIQPEGEALIPCCRALEAAHKTNPGFLLGYVTDNDGDRGTTVMIENGVARPMEAQEVFALACVSRLATLVYQGVIRYNEHGRCTSKVAVVCNGPTSLRIDRIAKAFDVSVFRAEVGEANVVGLAAKLRERGYLVPLLGEGSNGGCIVPPAQVRDPLLTVSSILALLLPPTSTPTPTPTQADTGASSFASPVDAWCSRIGSSPPHGEIQPAELLNLLPACSTTGVAESRAVVALRTQDYGPLKNAYELAFHDEWLREQSKFRLRYGFSSYEVVNHVGAEERHGAGPSFRQGAERAGMKILFRDDAGEAVGFLWMRPSGTEPVFRVCVDIVGTRPREEAELLELHTSIIHRAEDSILGA